MSTKKTDALEFGERLMEACGTREVAEIARLIGVEYQTAKNYIRGRLPAAEVLIAISRSTNVSIHWLLTGEGARQLQSIAAVEGGAEPEDAVEQLLLRALTRLKLERRSRQKKAGKVG